MQEANLIGYEENNVEFNGRSFYGYRLHLAVPPRSDQKVVGYVVFTQQVSKDQIKDALKVGQTYQFDYIKGYAGKAKVVNFTLKGE